MTERTTVILPSSLRAKLGYIAHTSDKLESEVIRDALRFYLEESEDFEDIDWDSLELEVAEPEEIPPPPDD